LGIYEADRQVTASLSQVANLPIIYIERVESIDIVVADSTGMGITISGFDDTTVLSIMPISESIKELGVIKCDICKKAIASYDLFMKGIREFPFLKRCCEQCAKSVNAAQGQS
jgi:hypothetical protein